MFISKAALDNKRTLFWLDGQASSQPLLIVEPWQIRSFLFRLAPASEASAVETAVTPVPTAGERPGAVKEKRQAAKEAEAPKRTVPTEPDPPPLRPEEQLRRESEQEESQQLHSRKQVRHDVPEQQHQWSQAEQQQQQSQAHQPRAARYGSLPEHSHTVMPQARGLAYLPSHGEYVVVATAMLLILAGGGSLLLWGRGGRVSIRNAQSASSRRTGVRMSVYKIV
mgnify:CR=1 FL=1